MQKLSARFGRISGTLNDSALPSVTHLSSGRYPLSSNCFLHVRYLIVLRYPQPPSPFLRQLSLTSQVLWLRLTSASSAIPCGMGYASQRVPRRPPRIRCNNLHSMQPPHLRDRVRVVWDFDLSCSLVRSAPPYMRFLFVSLELLPPASFRFRLAADALALG